MGLPVKTPQQFRARVPGPVTLSVEASFLLLEVAVSPQVGVAEAVITGPPDAISAVRAEMHGRDTWHIAFPATSGGAGMTIINTGGVSNVVMAGGRIIVNGVDMTNAGRARGSAEPLRAMVRLPVGSSLDAQVQAGQITVQGPLATLEADTASADVEAQAVGSLRASTASGDVAASLVVGGASTRTASGDIRLVTRGPVEADTASGDISVHAERPVRVRAQSASGDVRVTADRGVCPDVRARSVTGRVRTP